MGRAMRTQPRPSSAPGAKHELSGRPVTPHPSPSLRPSHAHFSAEHRLFPASVCTDQSQAAVLRQTVDGRVWRAVDRAPLVRQLSDQSQARKSEANPLLQSLRALNHALCEHRLASIASRAALPPIASLSRPSVQSAGRFCFGSIKDVCSGASREFVQQGCR